MNFKNATCQANTKKYNNGSATEIALIYYKMRKPGEMQTELVCC